MYIFISHSSQDAAVAQELCREIEAKGFQCFIAPRDIRSGYEYAAEIIDGIDRADAMLLVLSEKANQSPHILREVERAVTKSVPIMVYKLEEVALTKSMEYFLMTHQWMNAQKGNYEDVIRCITELEKKKMPAKEPMAGSGDRKEMPAESRNKKGFPSALKILIPLVVVIALAVILVVQISKNRNHQEALPEETVVLAEPKPEENTVKADTETKAEDPVTESPVETDVKLGDTVVFGRYNGADIAWRVLKISEDGKEAVLVAGKVLTVKAYDAAESGKYNFDGEEYYYSSDSAAETDMELQAYVRGNSSWEASNIRTWLNSADENVKYDGQPPAAEAMADFRNGYNNEPGFLNDFTEEELAAIKETTVETKGNALSESETVTTTDRVFLLSMEELEWFEEADVSLLAEPTPEAVEQDGTTWYQDYCLDFGVNTHMWWLREPVSGSSSQCYLIGNGYYENNIYQWEVGVESFGIRPAITVDLTAGCIKAE